jgi:hypothetical protein
MPDQTPLRRIASNCRELARAARDDLARNDLLAMALEYEGHALELEQLAAEEA